MARNQINKCLWVLDTIYRTGGISYKDIAARWDREHAGDGMGKLSNSTFRYYIGLIEEMFDLNIDCIAADGYKYRITSEHDLYDNNAKSRLLNAFAVDNLLSDNRALEGRVLYEDVPSGHPFLIPLLEAMREGLRVEVCYRRFNRAEPLIHIVEPYAVKVDRRRWYLLACDPATSGMFHLALDRMIRLETTEQRFDIAPDFDIDAFYDGAFGVIVGDRRNLAIEHVRIKVYNDYHRADYLSTLPLHHSQKMIEVTPAHTIFEYRLRPTDDFLSAITELGGDAEVLSPAWFRDYVATELRRALDRYNH